jgi:prevent-host-death family protein
MRWRLDQIIGVKDAARSLPALIERNEAVVLTRRGEPKAVLLPLAEYERVWLNEQGMNGMAPSEVPPK